MSYPYKTLADGARYSAKVQPPRRQFLALGGTVGSSALAGCARLCTRGLPLIRTGMRNDAEVATEHTETVPQEATIVEFSALPPAEQSLVRTAVREGVVRACLDGGGDQAAAIQSFADRTVEESAYESTYLAYEGDHYGLWVRIADQEFVGTASPPEVDENPCC